MAVEYSVMLYKSPDSARPFNEIFDYDYQRIRQIAYAKTPAGGYSRIMQQTWKHGSPVYYKGMVYRRPVGKQYGTVFEFPSGKVRILRKDGSFGKYISKEW